MLKFIPKPSCGSGAAGWDLVRRFPMSAGSVCTSRGQICTTSSLRGAGDSTRDNSRLALQAFEFAVYDAIKIPGYSSAPARRFGVRIFISCSNADSFQDLCLPNSRFHPLGMLKCSHAQSQYIFRISCRRDNIGLY